MLCINQFQWCPSPPGQPRGICLLCQSRGLGISIPRGDPPEHLTHVFLCARAHLRALMTQKSCAVGMRNATLRKHLKGLCFNQFQQCSFPPPGQPWCICSRCQSRGWGIRNFIAAPRAGYTVFPNTVCNFLQYFQNCSEYQTNVPEHFPRISEDVRRLPKTSEEDPKMFR